MINNKEVQIFNQLISNLPKNIREYLLSLPEKIKTIAQEIRIRVDSPLCIVSCEKMHILDLTTSQTDIQEILQNICNHSVYSFQEQLKEGFITFKGGHRIGIGATAVIENGRISNLKNITSFNIRIAKEFKNCSDQLYEIIKNDTLGTLIVGSPSSGKTTLLRDISRKMALSGNKVTIVDSRFEISGVWNGAPQMDISLCDILAGFPKSLGILQALRCLSPEVIICDEIGTLDDANSIAQCLNSGVKIIASMHSKNLNQFIKKPQARSLLKCGGFQKIVFLEDFHSPGKIHKIVEVGDFFSDKNISNFTFDNIGNLSGIYDFTTKLKSH